MARYKKGRDDDTATNKSTTSSRNKKSKVNDDFKKDQSKNEIEQSKDIYAIPLKGSEMKLDLISSTGSAANITELVPTTVVVAGPVENKDTTSSNKDDLTKTHNITSTSLMKEPLNSLEMNAVNALLGGSNKSSADTPTSKKVLPDEIFSNRVTKYTPEKVASHVPTIRQTFYSPNRSSASTGQIGVKPFAVTSDFEQKQLFKAEDCEKDNNFVFKPPATHIEVVKKARTAPSTNKKDRDDSMSLHDENDESSVEADNFTKFHKKTQDAHERGKYNSLKQAHIFSINNYCKDSLWRRAKFINDRQLGAEFHNICKHLNIDPEEHHDKYVDICLLVNTNMNYRRSYSTKCIRDTLIAKLVDKTMFDINLMQNFYLFEESKNENEPPFAVSEDVKAAYYIFINDFCGNVSSVWKKYLKGGFCEYRDTASFVQKLTRSDEAYAYWLILCLYEKCEADAQFIKENSWDKWNKSRKKGKAGKHNSLIKFDSYVEIYNKISVLRENEKAYDYWQKVFFDKFFNESQQESVKMNDAEKRKDNNATISIPKDFD